MTEQAVLTLADFESDFDWIWNQEFILQSWLD